MRNGRSVELDLLDPSRMDNIVDFLSDRLKYDNKSGYFHTAAGRTRAGSDDHEENQQSLAEFRPFVKIGRRVSRRSDDRADLEGCMAQGVAEAVHSGDIDRYDHNRDENKRNIGSYLRHPERKPQLFSDKVKIKLKIDTAGDHENRRYDLQ